MAVTRWSWLTLTSRTIASSGTTSSSRSRNPRGSHHGGRMGGGRGAVPGASLRAHRGALIYRRRYDHYPGCAAVLKDGGSAGYPRVWTKDQMLVEHYARHPDGWLLTEARDAANLALPALGCALPLAKSTAAWDLRRTVRLAGQDRARRRAGSRTPPPSKGANRTARRWATRAALKARRGPPHWAAATANGHPSLRASPWRAHDVDTALSVRTLQ